MLSINKALGIYSDKLADGEKVDIIEMSKLVDNNEREEFIELAEFVEMASLLKATESFNKIFEKLNDYKEDYYSYCNVSESAANFRSEKGKTGNKDIVDKIFDEAFGDEE